MISNASTCHEEQQNILYVRFLYRNLNDEIDSRINRNKDRKEMRMKDIFHVLPMAMKEFIKKIPENDKANMEEIRLRIGRPMEIVGLKQPTRSVAPVFTEKDASQMISLLSQHSLYRLEEELRRGYITIPGGHRVGIAGRVVIEKGQVKGLREIGSYNIRIAKEKRGVSEVYVKDLYRNGYWTNTLIIGPPKTGKTTLLRDLARQISLGIPQKGILAKNVAIVDERSEIAGCIHGVPQHDFGTKVDVLDACPKAEGMMMMIRSMSPDVLVVDEIGREEDGIAMMEAVYAGVSVISTVHGTTLENIKKRPTIKKLLEESAFETIIEVSDVGKKGVCKYLSSRGKSEQRLVSK